MSSCRRVTAEKQPPQPAHWLCTLLIASGLLAATALPLVVIADDASRATHATNNSMVMPNRTFGYVLGDVLEQRIPLVRDAHTITLEALPPLERTGPWLQRLSAAISEEGHWLTLRYQIINAPPAHTLVELPSLTLNTALTADDNTAELHVAPFPFTLSPIITALGTADGPASPVMQANHTPTLANPGTARGRTVRTAMALLACLLAWGSWTLWRSARDTEQLPFAQALHRLKRLRGSSQSNDNIAWRNLHRAFDRTSGHTVHTGSLTELLSNHPWLQAHGSDIQRFYAASTARFFANGNSRDTQRHTMTTAELLSLCRTLARAEAQQAAALFGSSTPSRQHQERRDRSRPATDSAS